MEKETSPQFGVLAELIGSKCAQEMIDKLSRGELSPFTVNLLNSFLPNSIHQAIHSNTLGKILDSFKRASRDVQALAIRGLRVGIQDCLERIKAMDTSLSSQPSDTFSPHQLLNLLELAQNLWHSQEARRRAMNLICQLEFPVCERDFNENKWKNFGYTIDDECEWVELLAKIGPEPEQLRAVEVIREILKDPNKIAPSLRREQDGLPDISAILRHLIDIQKGSSESES